MFVNSLTEIVPSHFKLLPAKYSSFKYSSPGSLCSPENRQAFHLLSLLEEVYGEWSHPNRVFVPPK